MGSDQRSLDEGGAVRHSRDHDFELGRRVAKRLSVEHHAIDLTSKDWSWDLAGLRATAEAAIRPAWVFDRYVRRTLAKDFGNEALFWTGYMGDVLGG